MTWVLRGSYPCSGWSDLGETTDVHLLIFFDEVWREASDSVLAMLDPSRSLGASVPSHTERLKVSNEALSCQS